MTFDEFAWAVGVFEGEGCISKTRKWLQLTLRTTDGDIAERFCAAVGVGAVHGPHEHPLRDKGYKPYWQWHGYGQDGRELLERMLPYLGERRGARAREVLATTKCRQRQDVAV